MRKFWFFWFGSCQPFKGETTSGSYDKNKTKQTSLQTREYKLLETHQKSSLLLFPDIQDIHFGKTFCPKHSIPWINGNEIQSIYACPVACTNKWVISQTGAWSLLELKHDWWLVANEISLPSLCQFMHLSTCFLAIYMHKVSINGEIRS